jgi:hypothetical protein
LSGGNSAHPAIVGDPAVATPTACDPGVLLCGVELCGVELCGVELCGVELCGGLAAGRRLGGVPVARRGRDRLTLVGTAVAAAGEDEVAVEDGVTMWPRGDVQAAISRATRADARPARRQRIPASCRIPTDACAGA